MAPNPLQRHAPWRQILIVAVGVPVVLLLAVTAFARPGARLAPRHLPVGVIGAGGDQIAAGLAQGEPGAFEIHRYGDESAARSAIEHRDVYAAFGVSPTGIRVFTASAASPTVAAQATVIGQRLAAASGTGRSTVVDVVPAAAADPRGIVLSSSVLPLVFGGMVIGIVIALVLGLKPAWRQVLALIVVSSTSGFAAFAVAQLWLGALPGLPWATWASMALTLLAVGSTVAGLFALFGPAGIGLSAVLMIFLGNPWSGVTSAPELLPTVVGRVGQWLPPGAGGNLLRSTAFFDGHGAAGHLVVLGAWVAAGLLAVVIGHRRRAPAAGGEVGAAMPVAAR